MIILQELTPSVIIFVHGWFYSLKLCGYGNEKVCYYKNTNVFFKLIWCFGISHSTPAT